MAKLKKQNKLVKAMSFTALMSTLLTAGPILTNAAPMMASGEPVATTLSTTTQSTGPSVSIQGKNIALPATLYVVKRVETQTYVNWNKTSSNSTTTEIAAIELTDEASLSQLDSYKYNWSSQYNYPDEYDESNYNVVTTYTNEIFLTKNGTSYSNKITPPAKGANYGYVYDAGDSFAPVTSGTLSYVTSPDNVVSLETILSNIKAVDNIDGDITLTEDNVVSNEYHGGNESVLGNHKIVISVSDTAGNVATIDVIIMVSDLSAPVFTGTPSSVDAYMSRNLTIDNFKSLVKISDDIDELTIEDVVVAEDNYTPNKNVPGTYTIKFTATDSAGNVAEHVMSAVVKDDIKPTITGTSSYTKGSTDVQMTLDGMLNNLSVSDNVSTLEKSQLNIVSDTYSGNQGKVGTYKVVVNIMDEAGNTSDNFTITIAILDDVAPVFWANNSFYVHVDGSVALSNTQLAYIARSLGIVDNKKDASVQIISNEYEGNESTKGEYVVSVLAVYEDGTQNTGSFTLSVDSDFNDAVVIPADEEPLKWYEKAWNGIKWFFSFKWLTTPLKWIWNHIVEPIWEALKWLGNKLF